RIALVQADPLPDRNLIWTQRVNVLVASTDGARSVPIELDRQRAQLPAAAAEPDVALVLPPADGLAYGRFELDAASRGFPLQRLPDLADPVARGAAWITLWDEMLAGRVPPAQLMRLALAALPRENAEQNIQFILSLTGDIFWRFLPEAARSASAPELESLLRSGLRDAPTASLKAAWFDAFRR